MQMQKKRGLAMRALSLSLHERGAQLSSQEFEKVLGANGLFPSKVQLQTLMKSFGGDRLCVSSFLAAARPALNARRAAVVQSAWERIAGDSSSASLARLQECYDVSRNADFLEGTLTKEQIFEQFCQGLSHNGQPVTEVRRDSEWRFYNEDLSLSVVDDEYFVRMTEAVWGVSEHATATVSRQEVEHLVKTIRKRCLDLSTATLSAEAVLRSIYREVDWQSRSGNVDSTQLAQVLRQLQINVDLRFLDALLKPLDREGHGIVEFEELVGYLMENPYK